MKDNNYLKIIYDINNILKENCDEGRMKYHILPVVENSKYLALKLNADIEVVEISAYLHDITRLFGDISNHHITGAEYAEKFLEKHNYPMEKIELIKRCILNHRGSINNNRISDEEKIIATADAMAHIQYPLPLFYTWYGKKKKSLFEGAKDIENKLKRSWEKIEYDFIKNELKEKFNYLMEVVENYE